MSSIAVFQGFGDAVSQVARTLLPLSALFLVFQVFFLRLPRSYMRRVIVGLVGVFVGLSLFLQGVNIAFVPLGRALGAALGRLGQPLYTLPVGFVLGMLVVLAEPSARVLSGEVEKASAGRIRERILLAAMASGVAVLVSLGYYFIASGRPLTHIIVPGYVVSLALLRWIDPEFVAISFDSGAVATGPLTVTFLMSLGLGIAAETNPSAGMGAGFGLVCLIALASTLAVQVLSFAFATKGKRRDPQ